MQLGNNLDYAGDPTTSAALASVRERAGVDVMWVSEAWGFDAPTMMGYLAAKTERLQVGSDIMNVFSRTPSAMAQTAAGLDNVSGGRAILGLGASGPQVVEGFHGVPYTRPLSRVRDTVEVIRKVLRRDEPLVHAGATVTIPLPEEQGTGLGKPLKLINHPERPTLPIFLASVTNASVAMTAELADGWLPAFFIPERAAEAYREPLAKGLAKRDPGLGPLAIAAGGFLAVAEGEERVRMLDRSRAQLALYIGGMGARTKNFYNDLFVSYGYADEARLIQDLFLDGKKAQAEAAIPLTVLENANLVGSEAFIRERIAAYDEAGVTILNANPLVDDPELLSKVKSWLP
ncbi:LLM class F420-dependent oxidoreductase [Georgenia sp. SYP-B2076]|uniref:LLM class F420-dependent oxidoreductase n=1 Tax=Georgenia sp. SYP-B2076 TaxID=2495881 RepID=UPI000F8D5D4C|nr:LLM class F420-dependent oxidoreductase [Georgenia sp. SYP-B2076]